MQELYRPTEVQGVLGIKKTKFWSLVKEGKLEAKKLGRATVITADSLKRFVKSLPLAK